MGWKAAEREVLVEAASSRVPFGRHKRVSLKAEDVEKSKTEEKRDGNQEQ